MIHDCGSSFFITSMLFQYIIVLRNIYTMNDFIKKRFYRLECLLLEPDCMLMHNVNYCKTFCFT